MLSDTTTQRTEDDGRFRAGWQALASGSRFLPHRIYHSFPRDERTDPSTFHAEKQPSIVIFPHSQGFPSFGGVAGAKRRTAWLLRSCKRLEDHPGGSAATPPKEGNFPDPLSS